MPVWIAARDLAAVRDASRSRRRAETSPCHRFLPSQCDEDKARRHGGTELYARSARFAGAMGRADHGRKAQPHGYVLSSGVRSPHRSGRLCRPRTVPLRDTLCASLCLSVSAVSSATSVSSVTSSPGGTRIDQSSLRIPTSGTRTHTRSETTRAGPLDPARGGNRHKVRARPGIRWPFWPPYSWTDPYPRAAVVEWYLLYSLR